MLIRWSWDCRLRLKSEDWLGLYDSDCAVYESGGKLDFDQVTSGAVMERGDCINR